MSELDTKKKENPENADTNSSSGIKIDFKPSDEKVGPLSVKKTADQIKAEEAVIINKTEQKSNLDINKNLGSFGPNAVVTNKETATQINVVTTPSVESTKKEEEKKLITDGKDAKINFEKFTNKKKVKESKTKLGIKLDIWLRNRKTLFRIWLIAGIIILILWATQITYAVLANGIIAHHNDIAPYHLYLKDAMIANVFCFVSIGLPVLPFLFFLVCAVVGINGVLVSKNFHYFLWIVLMVAFACFIVSTVFDGIFLTNYYSFIPPYTA